MDHHSLQRTSPELPAIYYWRRTTPSIVKACRSILLYTRCRGGRSATLVALNCQHHAQQRAVSLTDTAHHRRR
jgi:hypothetical protein